MDLTSVVGDSPVPDLGQIVNQTSVKKCPHSVRNVVMSDVPVEIKAATCTAPYRRGSFLSVAQFPLQQIKLEGGSNVELITEQQVEEMFVCSEMKLFSEDDQLELNPSCLLRQSLSGFHRRVSNKPRVCFVKQQTC
ncbi:hypothetical protein Q8A73_009301 [Channa argus]|nr:hypothetical protein Q8A73_009301 [Channa argus]